MIQWRKYRQQRFPLFAVALILIGVLFFLSARVKSGSKKIEQREAEHSINPISAIHIRDRNKYTRNLHRIVTPEDKQFSERIIEGAPELLKLAMEWERSNQVQLSNSTHSTIIEIPPLGARDFKRCENFVDREIDRVEIGSVSDEGRAELRRLVFDKLRISRHRREVRIFAGEFGPHIIWDSEIPASSVEDNGSLRVDNPSSTKVYSLDDPIIKNRYGHLFEISAIENAAELENDGGNNK